MRIFLDTNILIDLLEARGEFTQNALKVASMVINNGDELLLSDLSVVNACYIERKSLGNRGFIATFSAIRDCFEIIGMGAPAIDALSLLIGMILKMQCNTLLLLMQMLISLSQETRKILLPVR